MAHADMMAGTSVGQLNAFPILFPDDVVLTYRIWAIDPIPLTSELREKIRSYLWQKGLRQPVSPIYVDQTFAFATPDRGQQESVVYVGEGERRYTIRPTETRRTITLALAHGGEVDLATMMIQAEIVQHLRHDQRLFHGHSATSFYLTAPDQPYRTRPNPRERAAADATVDIFRGFTFRVMHVDGVGFCVVLDVRTSYIGRDSLASYLARNTRPRDLESDRGVERWVNDYGHVKQAVYLVRPEERTIGETVLRDERTTFDYLQATYPAIRDRITTHDRAATIMYRSTDERNEDKHYPAAATLLKPKFTVGSRDVRSLGDTSAFPSQERRRRIDILRTHIDGARFASTRVALGPPLTLPHNVLPLPRLLFGPPDGPTLLRADSLGRTEEERRIRWGQRKMAVLNEHGPYRRAEFVNPYLVYPASLDDGLIDDFLARTQSVCKEYGRTSFAPELSPYRDNAHPRDIIAKLKGIAAAQRAGFILLALPADGVRASQVYAGIKTQISLPSKCFSAAQLRAMARDARALAGYIVGNTLAMLVENGTRPWGLADSLAHEMQFGFDVARYGHGGLMGAAVVSNAAATGITFVSKEIDARERIPTPIMRRFVFDALEQFYDVAGRPPRSILFQRDGRFLDAENKGVRQALDRFAQEHSSQPAPLWATVAIEKVTSVPLRLFRDTDREVANAFGGTFFVQNPWSAYLVLAGYPSLRQGTPRPLRASVIASSAGYVPDIATILQDIFWLAQLNWSSPEIDIKAPMTLRFSDRMLERYALEVEDEDEDEGWDDDA